MNFDALGEIIDRLRREAQQVPVGVALSPAMLARLRRSIHEGESWMPGIPYVVDPRLGGLAEAFFDESLWRERCADQRRWDAIREVAP